MPEYRNSSLEVVTLGSVKSDGTPDISDVLHRFPVPYQQMRIRQEVRIDKSTPKGRSGSIKQATGYNDSEISISLTLVDMEDKSGAVEYSALDQFKALQAAFRDRSDPVTDGSTSSASYAVPTVFAIFSPLIDACGIKTVLFKSLEVGDAPGVNDLEVSLVFEEFDNIARQVERRRREAVKAQNAEAEAQAASEAAADATTDATADEGKEDPLSAAFRQGKTDAMGGLP